MAAADFFEFDILGKGGHGAMPHLGIDPVVAAAAIVQSLQSLVSRETGLLLKLEYLDQFIVIGIILPKEDDFYFI